MVPGVTVTTAWPVGWPSCLSWRKSITGRRQVRCLTRRCKQLWTPRCILHFRNGQDNNLLTWAAQEEAVAQQIGVCAPDMANSAEWMRVLFGHARSIYRISGRLLEEMPAAQSLFYRQLETWRTGFSDSDFSVVDGLIFLQPSVKAADPQLLFRMIRLIAQRGFKLSPATEHQVEQ